MTNKQQVTVFGSPDQLKVALAGEYRKQIENYFGDPKQALRFLSGVIASVQRTPKILECDAQTVINSFMTMAQLGFMPSDVSGEAHVIPRKNGKSGKMEAQFQLGYQGLATLFYRAGIRKIVAEIVYEHDEFDYQNGEITHRPNIWAEDRGAAKGAYTLITLPSNAIVAKVMAKHEILDIGKKFSKSFGTDFSPWNAKNDPQLWMWRKTVLKQAAKLVPKNQTIIDAIAKDNEESVIADRLPAAKADADGLRMGNLLKTPEPNENADSDEDDEKDADIEITAEDIEDIESIE